MAHQTQVDAAAPTSLCLVGQCGESAAAHEIEPGDVDDERSGRRDAGGGLGDQLTPEMLVAAIDLAARVDQQRCPAAVSGCPQRAVWVA
ncbi:Uncharacterised protein [Mycobacterium tuberculosis]|nr:Uncharacterised protein [Mycobacterium tuberculosis]COY41092.1 Uncharacterised protein [Mycobacterium tuberculosis]